MSTQKRKIGCTHDISRNTALTAGKKIALFSLIHTNSKYLHNLAIASSPCTPPSEAACLHHARNRKICEQVSCVSLELCATFFLSFFFLLVYVRFWTRSHVPMRGKSATHSIACPSARYILAAQFAALSSMLLPTKLE